MCDLSKPIFHDADAAREHLEAIRWADGRFCPHCGEAERTSPIAGTSHRPGLYYCNSCRKQFTVSVGTLFERSHVPLNKWVMAFHLMSASKKGISSHQLHRMLGVTYKTAWFMTHRIREAMRDDVAASGPLGGAGKNVEADETYFGKRTTPRKRRGNRPYTKGGKSGGAQKLAVVALVERGGKARTFHVDGATRAEVREILVRNVSRDTTLQTDESPIYTRTGAEFAGHETVKHTAGEYVRGSAHTNTVEGYFSIFKRGMKGVYQHCAEKHLHRYLSEFDFRYNHRTALGVTDAERALIALKGIEGKRLTYRRTAERAAG